MRNKVVKELSEKYPLSREDIGHLYDLVEGKHKLFSEFSISEQCEIIIRNSIQHVQSTVMEFYKHTFEVKKTTRTPEQIAMDTVEGMRGIGGMPTNEEFYAEFDYRLRVALGLWRKEDEIIDAGIRLSGDIHAVDKCVTAYIKFKRKLKKLDVEPKPKTIVDHINHLRSIVYKKKKA